MLLSGPARRRTARRRVTLAGVYAGSGLLGVGGGLVGVVKAEAALARRAIGPANERLVDPDGSYGDRTGAPPLRLLVLGDSAAAGYGMNDRLDTPPGLIGSGLAHISSRPVHVRSQAFVGARSCDLATQLDEVAPPMPSACVIVVGANDVTHSVRPMVAAAELGEVVRRLTTAGVAVVVGTCPDLGTLTPLQPPLRQIARVWAHRLARAQTVAVASAGGRAVSLGSLLGPDFYAAPGELFGADRFHPSLAGYASMSAALLPSLAAALDLRDDSGLGDDSADAVVGIDATPGADGQRLDRLDSGILPVSFAAARAMREPGTETVGVSVDAGDRRGRGRWARVRRPRALPQLPGWWREDRAAEAAAEPAADKSSG